MDAASKIETRAWVKFEIIVVKDTKLKDRYEVVQYISRQLNLNTAAVRRRRL